MEMEQELQSINRPAMTTSPVQWQRDGLALTLVKTGSSEISVFRGEAASISQIAASVKKLSVAFPQMNKDFFNLLSERIVKSGMTTQRLEYAVNHVLDHFTYKQLTIADILSVDVRCRVLSYAGMISEVAKSGTSTDDYAPVFIGESKKPAWVSKVDKSRYNLPDRI